MNHLENRIRALQKTIGMEKDVVIIVDFQDGVYSYKGKSYTPKQFEAFKELHKNSVMIIDDIPRTPTQK